MRTHMNTRPRNDLCVSVVKTYTLNAPIQETFPFISPILEYKWIPGWKAQLVHFPNGRMESGCIFREFTSAPILADGIARKSTWTVVLFDPDDHTSISA